MPWGFLTKENSNSHHLREQHPEAWCCQLTDAGSLTETQNKSTWSRITAGSPGSQRLTQGTSSVTQPWS